MKTDQLGIMQGRLSPPRDNEIQSFPKDTWHEEFFKAKGVGLFQIEWIFESDEWEKNPISGDMGVREVNKVIRDSGVRVVSVCADYFMDVPYLKAYDSARKELREKLEWLVVQTSKIGGKFIDVPLVDSSAITHKDEFWDVQEFIVPAAKRAETLGVTITLETSLNPDDFRELLILVNHPCIMANYDTGNSAALGYNCAEEISAYGKWIRTVHVKDRKLHGTSVPLGTGNADFPKFFHQLSQLAYSGPFVLQAAREGDELQTARKNLGFLMQFFKERSN